jgi:hypothetical protein
MRMISAIILSSMLAAGPAVGTTKGSYHATAGRHSVHAHYPYQGGHYAGGHGSSHRGGHYVNPRTGNHYTHHQHVADGSKRH